MPDSTIPLSDLLSNDLLPEELHLSNLIPGFLDDIQFKNHMVTNESDSGHEATHNLTLVFSKTISFAFPGTGIKLLLNPAVNGSQQATEFDIQVYYKWEIIRFINDFKIENVPTDLDGLLDAIKDIYNLNTENILQKLIGLYEEAADTILVPIQVITDELNRFYAFAGTANEISFELGETPSFDLLKTKLEAVGKTLADVVADFNLVDVVSDPNSAIEVLGAVIKKGIYKLVETLNVQYSLTGPDKFDYDLNLDFSGIATKLSGLGHDAFGIIKDLVVDVTSSFATIKEELFNFLKIGVTDLPTSFKDLFIPEVDATATNVNLALEFPRSILIPMDDDDKFLPVPDTAKLTFQVGDLSFSTQNGFDYTEVSTCELKQASVLETGLTVEFEECVIDFHDDTNIPQADADNRPLTFKGVFIDEATIKLPKIWQVDDSQPTTAVIKGEAIYIQAGGGVVGAGAEAECGRDGHSAETSSGRSVVGRRRQLPGRRSGASDSQTVAGDLHRRWSESPQGRQREPGPPPSRGRPRRLPGGRSDRRENRRSRIARMAVRHLPAPARFRQEGSAHHCRDAEAGHDHRPVAAQLSAELGSTGPGDPPEADLLDRPRRPRRPLLLRHGNLRETVHPPHFVVPAG